MCPPLRYYVKTDSQGYPIPGTQRAYPTYICQCDLLLLTGSAMVAPEGATECKHPEGNRYFYRINRDGSVKPNSVFMIKGYPKGEVCVIEIKNYKNCS